MSRIVNVHDTAQKISFINKEQQEIHLGEVVQSVFEKEDLVGFNFSPYYDQNPFTKRTPLRDGKVYSLGKGSTGMQVVNPTQIQQIFIEKGYQVKDAWASNAGTKLVILMVDMSKSYNDSINFDLDFWGSKDNCLYKAARIEINLAIGAMVVHIIEGFYRLVCTNGLMSSILNLPEIKLSHYKWEISKVTKALENNNLALSDGLNYGQPLTTVNHLQKAHSLLMEYQEEKDSPTGLSDRFVGLKNHYKIFKENQLQSWTLDRFLTQIQYLINGKNYSDYVYPVEMVNCYTSAVNSHRIDHRDQADRGVWGADSIMDKVISNTINIAQMSAIFSDTSKPIYSIPAKVGKLVKVIETVEIDESEFVDYEDMEVTPDDYNNYLTNIA